MEKKTTKNSVSADKDGAIDQKGFLIVGIGASAGGLEALQQLLRSSPPDIGMAFVIVTHQHPEHTSMLAELLARETMLPVVPASDGTRLEANNVYVCPPGGYLTMFNGVLFRREVEKKEAPTLPIDYFFRSLADDQKEKGVCIVLSGTGSDGTLGLKAIKAESGMTMVQQPQSAKYSGMPSSAIATGLVDFVLPPEKMVEQLSAYARGPYVRAKIQSDKLLDLPDKPLQKIFRLLRNRTGHDFSAYKSNTIRRRIQRRMNVHQIQEAEEYVRYLQDNAHEVDLLFKELLISVTNFFRDADAWNALDEQLKALVRTFPDDQTLRAWVPGCATGEEVFSLGILLREKIQQARMHVDVQIFGTDLDADAVETARAGQYPEGIAADVSESRLKRFFVNEDGVYRICKEVREMTVFAVQNMIKDPPFTRVDILCCRNLLIYLDTELQRKLLPLFHYALKPGGILFLGSSETIGPFSDLFEPVDKRWKIFRRKENATAMQHLTDIPLQASSEEKNQAMVPMGKSLSSETHLTALIERMLLERFAPVSVIVNERGEIHYIHGRTGLYLEPAPGRPRNNILDMAREGLRIELAAAIRECHKTGKDVIRSDIPIKSNGDVTDVEMGVAMIHKPEGLRHLLLVTFRPLPGVVRKTRKRERLPARSVEAHSVAQLEQELQHIKESHQLAQEELETSNEELKSTNEELQSTNEELQSTNEELETSKEEMQSLNEELTTVNTELQSKVDELSKSNDDMQNLLNSTDVATIFLDNELNIQRYTAQARDLAALRQTDIGRPLFDLTLKLKYRNLMQDCQSVLKSLVFREEEVETDDGKSFLMRILPYRTSENVIEGLVLTFVNISRLKKAELAGEARVFYESIFDAMSEPMAILDEKLRVVAVNHEFYRQFQVEPGQVVGAFMYELCDNQWDQVELREQLQRVLSENAEIAGYEVPLSGSLSGLGVSYLEAQRLVQPGGDVSDLILLSINTKPVNN